MKSFNQFSALVIAVTLIAGITGCKKTPKSPTHIPRPGEVTVPSDAGSGTRLAGPTANPTRGNPANTSPGGNLPPDGGAQGSNLSNVNPGAENTTTSKALDPATSGNPGGRPDLENTDEDAKALRAETVYFDYDKATVKGSEVPKVQRVASFLKSDKAVSLRVEGNCDERGTEEYNRSLGERRALAIRELLINEGVAPERVTTVSFGEDKPIEQGHDEAAWAKNRRGDFVVLRARTNLQ